MVIHIRKAGVFDVDQILPLFEAYRAFYRQESNLIASRHYLMERLRLFETVIFIAIIDNTVVGFVQLFPTFSSVSLQRSLILNDLFVNADNRGQAIGSKLLEHCQNYTISHKYKGLLLETGNDNPARRLYFKMGWKLEEQSSYYFWKATN